MKLPEVNAFELLGNGGRVLSIKIGTTFYRRMFFLARRLNDSIPIFRTEMSIKIVALEGKNIPAYRRFLPDQSVNLVQTRLAQGDQCFAAMDNGDIVHGTWVATGQVYVPYLRRFLILSPEDVYLFNIYTLVNYRRQGLAASMGTFIMHYYEEHGYRQISALVAVENRAGWEMFQKLGYTSIGLYHCLKLGPWQWNWQTSWGEKPLPILTKAMNGRQRG